MTTRKSPLRDRLLSNSPDPIKSSILRESGMGWNSSTSASLPSSGSTGSTTSPLRIAKRDSPRTKVPLVARRTSSSYRHVHTNNLVSKSPFKSQIPTPSTPSSRPTPMIFPTRRVSGEKRPRPSSMHEQAENENERPLALKRERKQSKAFQGLIEKEPVTKSPFKLQQRTPSSEAKPSSPLSSVVYNGSSQRSLTPPLKLQPPRTSSGASPSPARSALVSRRLHGPRLSGGSRRQRRKTVHFHERCDVLEFDREEEIDEEDVFQTFSEEDERDDFYQGMHEEDDPSQGSSHSDHDHDEVMQDDTSYEERKQSKAFQGLIEKEPVTKSPFKLQQRTPSSEVKPPSPLSSVVYSGTSQRSLTPPLKLQPPRTSSGTSPSPARPVLVSRRLHGPLLSGGSRRQRRKTVYGNYERCDVLEFDREEEIDEEDVFQTFSEEDERDDFHQGLHEEDDPSQGSSHSDHDHDEVMQDVTSYESIQLSNQGVNPSVPSLLSDPDASITGIVDEMFFSSNAANLASDTSLLSNISTPPRHFDTPTDLETEDGVPFGRSHHVERFLQHHENGPPQQSPHILQPHFSPHVSPLHQSLPHRQSPSNYPFNFNLPTTASPHGPPATPPRRSPGMRFSTPPLGRSTHLERIKKAREEERETEAEDDIDIDKLPASPSPMKKTSGPINLYDEALIPKFDLNTAGGQSEANDSANISIDSFAPRLQDEANLLYDRSHSVSSAHDESTDAANLSVGGSETDLSSRQDGSLHVESTPPRLQDHPSPAAVESQAALSRRISPPARSASPMVTASSSRERISREEVQRRLLNQRTQSPACVEVLRSSSSSTEPPACQVMIEETVHVNDEKLDCQEFLEGDKDKDRLSVLTNISTESAIVERVEKRTMGLTALTTPGKAADQDFGMLGTGQFDFGSKFSLGGLGISASDVPVSVGSPDNQNLRGVNPGSSRPTSIDSPSVRLGDVDVDMDMKSALDRLMDDVAGAGARVDDSMATEECDDSYDQSQSRNDHDLSTDFSRPRIMERAATDSVLLQKNEADGIISRNVSGASGVSLPPPPVPAKDNIRQREQIILEKRREARRLEEEGMDAFELNQSHQTRLGVGRPSRRRSMSTGDAETLGGGAKKRGDVLLEKVGLDDPLGDSIERELRKLVEPPKKGKYHVRSPEITIYASSSEETVSHMAGPGDVEVGKAWRTVRRPSDMNEYAKQIREYRAQDKGKAYGKVFVKVLGVKRLNLPLPQQPTVMTCTLNNGIHFVTTPEGLLSNDCRVDQEFELIEHSKLEFTLTLKIRRDPHIIAQFKALAPPPLVIVAPPPPPPPIIPAAPKTSGMRSFFSSSPKKLSKEKFATRPQPQPQPQPQLQLQPQAVHQPPENLARHLKPDGMLARAFISFKDVSSRCDMRLFETSYPLIGQRLEIGGKFSTQECGEIILQMFRLPPLPGIPQDQLPQSLEECHRGLRHINWHKVTYFQGTLTQNGGDCRSWRRRQLRVIGSNLVAFNDVTKKATATIDLKKAIAVEDDQEPRSPSGGLAAPRASRYADEYDGLHGMERSFRLIFPHDQEIIFLADTDEEKNKWLEVLRALVGHIPPHPLWAELLWQRQEELSKRTTTVQQQVLPQSSRPPFRSRRETLTVE